MTSLSLGGSWVVPEHPFFLSNGLSTGQVPFFKLSLDIFAFFDTKKTEENKRTQQKLLPPHPSHTGAVTHTQRKYTGIDKFSTNDTKGCQVSQNCLTLQGVSDLFQMDMVHHLPLPMCLSCTYSMLGVRVLSVAQN